MKFKPMMFYLFGGAAAIYVTIGLGLYAFQGRLLFLATHNVDRTPADVGWEYEDLMLEHDGAKTHAWFVPAPGEGRGVVLFSHGNYGNISDRVESVGIFRDMGFDTLVYDYGGYGKSSGSPSENRCYRDIRAAWRYLTEDRGVDAGQIILFGRSLGAAVTADLAVDVNAAGVILESTFLSVPAVAQELYKFYPVRLLSQIGFHTAKKVGRIESPILIIHSPDDELVPYRHGRKLYELASEPKSFFDIQGPHANGFASTGPPYRRALDDFITPLLADKGKAAT